MILCVTPNAALDRTVVAPGYAKGGVLRATEVVVAPGGKGINVARATALLDGTPFCAGFLGGFTGRQVEALAEAEGFRGRWTWLPNLETRCCTIVVDPEGEAVVINERGAHVSLGDWARLHQDVLAAAAQVEAVCVCGSLPTGSPLDAFENLLRDLLADGKQVWVDTSGDPLEAAARVQGVRLKINDDEIGALLKTTVRTPEAAAAAARQLSSQMKAPCVITLGELGAIYADDGQCWHATPPKIQVVSAVGSGDSLLAGLVVGLELGKPPAEALRSGVAAGAANALSLGGGRFGLDEYRWILNDTSVETIY
ncbi:MAG: hexose kinase [Chloroflexota bacterium]|nr:hexose kinase [Chloroflexota bacterium]